MGKKHYIDRNQFHEVMTYCKKNDELNDEAISYFIKLSRNVARKYYYGNNIDIEDAASMSIEDLLKYWKNFKENNLVKLNILRNFNDGESIEIMIDGIDSMVFTAKSNPSHSSEFLIRDTKNRTIQEFKSITKEYSDKFMVYHDQVKCNLTIMDNHNKDNPNIFSSMKMIGSPDLYKIKKHKSGDLITFDKPPNAFSYFTSICNNAIRKYLNMANPKHLRDGNKISIQGININNNGLYSI